MKNIINTVFILFLLGGCAASSVTDEQIQSASQSLDYGDYTSSTLATKGWQAQADGNHTAAIAYTRKCIELYGERGRKMNAELTLFPPVEKVNDYWALNDSGTCMYIMATSFETLRMYPDAARAFRSLEDDYSFTQCWDPKGWYWQPASVAAGKADKYASR